MRISEMRFADCSFPVRWEQDSEGGWVARITELKLESERSPTELEAYENLYCRLVNLIESARERAVAALMQRYAA